jgi:hypothetical protein
MVRKTVKHSTFESSDDKNPKPENQEISAPVQVIDQWFNVHTMQYHPATTKFIQREAVLLKEWAEKDDSLRLCDFYDFRGYNTETFYRWCNIFAEMKAAHEFAKRRIGARRENGALHRKMDSQIVQRTLGYYDYVFDQEQQKAQAAKLAYAQNSEVKVLIETFPSVNEQRDIHVQSTSKLTPEKVAANIHRNTGTDRQIKVNSNIGGYEE